MGIDIHVYMEYRSRKKKRYMCHGRLESPRLYGLFETMCNVFSYVEPLYKAKGLPGDVTPQVLKEYKEYGGSAHYASWLTTEEFRECLDLADQRYSKSDSNDWLQEYKLIYSYLIDSEKNGEPARIVFWFDYS